MDASCPVAEGLGPAGLAPSGPQAVAKMSCSGQVRAAEGISPELPTCRPTLLNFWYFPIKTEQNSSVVLDLKELQQSGSFNSLKVHFLCKSLCH